MAVRDATPRGFRAYLRGVMLGGAVAIHQLGKDPESFEQPLPAFVQMLPDNDDRALELERVGPMVLTRDIFSGRTGQWKPNLN